MSVDFGGALCRLVVEKRKKTVAIKLGWCRFLKCSFALQLRKIVIKMLLYITLNTNEMH